MPAPESKSAFILPATSQRRLLGIALFLLGLFCLLILQYFRIQVVEHDKWAARASAQHQVVVKQPPRRGLFFSNTDIKLGHPQAKQAFVLDVAKFHLYIDPESIPAASRNEIARQIALLLHLKGEEIKKMRLQFEKKSRSRKIAMWIDAPAKDEIQAWWRAYARRKKLASNALFFVQDYLRSYPFGKSLGQVLHTVRLQRDEKTEAAIPTGGLEAILDPVLRGKMGRRLFYRSPRHEMDMGRVITPPEDGCDVTLTVNHCLQAIAEEEIEKQVVKSEAKGGWAIIMDPYTGEVLALAQYPFFDPRSYPKYFNNPALLEDTKVKAVTDPYEPGSTFKAITVAVALMANEELRKRGKPQLFTTTEKVGTVPCTFPGRTKILKDIKRVHRYLNMYMALQKSSNVYMAKMVQRIIEQLGAEWYRSTLHNVFGFGVKTRIELPSESAGLLPMPGKLHPNGKLEWSAPTPYSMAMGHNILANSFQMLRSFAIIANGGYDVKPTLVKRIMRGEEVIYDLGNSLAKKTPKRLLEPTISEEVLTAMRFTTKPGGSASKGDIPGYSEGGKTSTSEKIVNGVYSKKTHISTFIGFAPAKNPRFVLIVAVDEPAFKIIPGIGANQYGGNCAAPCFSKIGERALKYLGVEPDDPAEKLWLPEVNALKSLYDKWNGS